MGFGYASSRYCTGCKKTRSEAQFDEGKTLCRMCRGVKTPVARIPVFVPKVVVEPLRRYGQK